MFSTFLEDFPNYNATSSQKLSNSKNASLWFGQEAMNNTLIFYGHILANSPDNSRPFEISDRLMDIIHCILLNKLAET
jgi:hypothetical protein